MDLGTGIAISSLSLAGIGTFFLWRQVNTAMLREENNTLRRQKDDLDRQIRDIRSENQWLVAQLRKRSNPEGRYRSEFRDDSE
jgi:FtsZ-binding cell division protein ZapB